MNKHLLGLVLIIFSMCSHANKIDNRSLESFSQTNNPPTLQQFIVTVEKPGVYILAIYMDRKFKKKYEYIDKFLSGKIAIYDYPSGKLAQEINLLTDHRIGCNSLSFNRQGKQLLLGYAYYPVLEKTGRYIIVPDIISNIEDIIEYSIEFKRLYYYK